MALDAIVAVRSSAAGRARMRFEHRLALSARWQMLPPKIEFGSPRHPPINGELKPRVRIGAQRVVRGRGGFAGRRKSVVLRG
jgi:hypothetical protein